MRRLALASLLVACSNAAPEMNSDTVVTATDPSSASAGSTGEHASGGVDSGDPMPTTDDDPSGTGPYAPTAGSEDGDTGVGTTGAVDTDYTGPGIYPVGNARFTLQSGDRSLLVELWYPADASAAAEAMAGHPIEEFVPEGPDRDKMVELLGMLSPAGVIGTRLGTSSAFDAPPDAGGPWPLIAFSHCHNCVRFSFFTVAEHLASHGFMVVAPDHTDNTLFDPEAEIGEEFLLVRVADMQAALDAVLDPNAAAVPAPLRGLADPTRVGALGHSFGAATAGRLAQEDERVLAAMPIAAPPANPIFYGTDLAEIHVPLLFVLAEEDNSILEIGNNVLEMNYDAANTPARLLSIKDAGHWNFADICGLVEAFNPGCGDGVRQTMPGVMFTYLDINVGRGIAASYSLAFFDRWLRGNAAADAYLDSADPPDVVTSEARL